MHTLFFAAASTDHHGRSEKGVGRATNFSKIRERAHVAPMVGEHPSHGAGISQDPSHASAGSVFGLTCSGTAHTKKPMADLEMNKEMAGSFRPRANKTAPALEAGATSYMAHFGERRTRSTGTQLVQQPNNCLSGILGPGAQSPSGLQSFASTQYLAPPQELRMPGQPPIKPSIPFWTAGETHADFYDSHYRMEYRKAGTEKPLKKGSSLAASSPQLSGGDDPRAALRKALMKSHYSRTTGDCTSSLRSTAAKPSAAVVRAALGFT